MSRPSKGARLYQRNRKGRSQIWVIRDEGGIEISTGTEDRRQAETILAGYIDTRNRPSGPVDAATMTISQALVIYAEDHASQTADPARIGYAIDALDKFWGDSPATAIRGATCRRYLVERGVSAGTVRRELGVLQAALNYCAQEGHLIAAPKVWKPKSAAPIERWLTRQEAYWLIRASRNLRKDGRHLTKFILTGLYTGTRKAAILALRIDQPSIGGGYIDTAQGVMYRNAAARTQTKKRQTAARLPRKFLAHVRRWAANDCQFVVQDYHGMRVNDIRKGWASAVVLAEELATNSGVAIDLSFDTENGRKYVTPHVLKHTAITWAMQNSASIWDAASYFGTSAATIEKVYGHHHPDHQSTATDAMDSRVSGAHPRNSTI